MRRARPFPWLLVLAAGGAGLVLLCAGGFTVLIFGVVYLKAKANRQFDEVAVALTEKELEPIEKIEQIVVNNGPEPNDGENRIAVLFDPEMERFGISLVRLRDPRRPEKPKLLTRTDRGQTNNTRVQIEGFDYVWGRESPAAGLGWARDRGKVMKEIRSNDGRKWTSIMDYATERVRVTQAVEILIGEQTRLYDTALVKYVVWNRDTKRHTVGLRTMLDTHIGSIDGRPFYVPPIGDTPAHFVDAKEEFGKANIPQFLRPGKQRPERPIGRGCGAGIAAAWV